ncbi:MAG: hypothetical protein U0V49_03235 [Saprospiraceae bacterium]
MLKRLVFILCLGPFLMAAQNVQDTGIVFKPVYTKKEFKKESHDLKAYDKVVKEFRKSNAGTNIDLKNASLETLRETMKKEYDELNTRITARAKKFNPSSAKTATDTTAQSDLPKAYNPTIKNQIPRVDKNALLEGKSETSILLLYSRILNRENKVIRQLANMDVITEATPTSSYEEILRNAGEFRKYMKEEISLLAKEKGKKQE